MRTLEGRTSAKINLSLNVTGKRNDGYHKLNSVVGFCNIGDHIIIGESDTLNLMTQGCDTINDENNIVFRAAQLLREKSHITQGAAITLTKHLPIASGIGGGSGDAALTLHLLNSFWNCGYSLETLQHIGLELGADVPVCLHNQLCVMKGIGENISPIATDAKKRYVTLCNPRIKLETQQVFINLPSTHYSMEPSYNVINDVNLRMMRNDLEAVAISLCPSIGDILNIMNMCDGIICARMSGSGATCFALFPTCDMAEHCETMLRKEKPDYWTATGLVF